MPLLTFTAPVLLSATLEKVLVAAPADLVSVPTLLNTVWVPPWLKAMVPSARRFTSAPARLLKTAPKPEFMVSVASQFTVPELLITPAPLKALELPAPAMLSVPVAATLSPPRLSVPPLQLPAPLSVRLPVPPSVPLERVNALVLAGVSKVTVPPLTSVVPTAL